MVFTPDSYSCLFWSGWAGKYIGSMNQIRLFFCSRSNSVAFDLQSLIDPFLTGGPLLGLIGDFRFLQSFLGLHGIVLAAGGAY